MGIWTVTVLLFTSPLEFICQQFISNDQIAVIVRWLFNLNVKQLEHLLTLTQTSMVYNLLFFHKANYKHSMDKYNLTSSTNLVMTGTYL